MANPTTLINLEARFSALSVSAPPPPPARRRQRALSSLLLPSGEPVSVEYVNNELDVHSWIEACVCRRNDFVLSLDAEFMASGAQDVEVLQLATRRNVIVIHFCFLERAPRDSPAFGCIARLVRDPRVTLVGVKVSEDVVKVLRATAADVDSALLGAGAGAGARPGSLTKAQAVIDLEDLVRDLPEVPRPASLGLERLTQFVLPHVKTWKPKDWRAAPGKPSKERLYQWRIEPLEPWQIEYCAMDAWAGRAVYDRFLEMSPRLCAEAESRGRARAATEAAIEAARALERRRVAEAAERAAAEAEAVRIAELERAAEAARERLREREQRARAPPRRQQALRPQDAPQAAVPEAPAAPAAPVLEPQRPSSLADMLLAYAAARGRGKKGELIAYARARALVCEHLGTASLTNAAFQREVLSCGFRFIIYQQNPRRVAVRVKARRNV